MPLYSKSHRFWLVGLVLCLVSACLIYLFLPGYTRSKVHPAIRDLREPLKMLVLTPFRNGFVIDMVDAEDRASSAMLEFGGDDNGISHKLQVKTAPSAQQELVDDAHAETCDTSFALAELVNRYGKPGKNLDEALFHLTDGKKYRIRGAVRALGRAVSKQ